MMASHIEMEIEKDEQQTPDDEPDLDLMTQQVQSLFQFKNDQMDVDGAWHLR